MLIQGSDNVTEGQLMMHLWNAKEDDKCTELELKEIDFEPGFVSAVIESLPSKRKWDSIRFTNCHGGSIVNDVIWGICSATNTPITTFALHQTTSSVDAMTFAAISYGLKYAKHWRNLSLAVHTIDYDAGNSLARSIALNTWLQSLDLGGSAFSAAALGPISFGLRLNRTLHKLSFDGCGLADDQMASILHALQEHPNLKVLSLQQNSCHDEGMGAIASILHYNIALEELDMSYLIRKKKDPQAQPVEEGKTTSGDEQGDTDEPETDGGTEESKDNDTKEETIKTDDETPEDNKDDVKDEGATSDLNDEGEPDDDSQKVRNTSLKSFQLAGNFLSDPFLDSLLGIFGKGSALEELNLFGNRVSDFGLRLILRKLPQLQNLKTLWLGHNLFSAHAAKELIPVMKSNYTLQDVNIRSLDDSEMEEVQAQIDHYCRLNRGGRRIFAKDKSTIPLSLWPLVMERAHTIRWGEGASNKSTAVHSHAADVLYCLLRGPVLFENPNIIF